MPKNVKVDLVSPNFNIGNFSSKEMFEEIIKKTEENNLIATVRGRLFWTFFESSLHVFKLRVLVNSIRINIYTLRRMCCRRVTT